MDARTTGRERRKTRREGSSYHNNEARQIAQPVMLPLLIPIVIEDGLMPSQECHT